MFRITPLPQGQCHQVNDIKVGCISFDYQLFANLLKVNFLIMSMFHSVPGVPCGKMERFASINTKSCGSPHRYSKGLSNAIKLREPPSGFKVGRRIKTNGNTVPSGTEPRRCCVPDGTLNDLYDVFYRYFAPTAHF